MAAGTGQYSIPPTGPDRAVLVLNAGSSSLKFALFRAGSPLSCVSSGAIDRIGSPAATFTMTGTTGRAEEQVGALVSDMAGGLDLLLQRSGVMAGNASFNAVGHRVVHGGPAYANPAIVDRALLEELRRIRSFDPGHLPSEIALMEGIASKFPDLPQVACFDTAFHQDLPRVARVLPIPRRYEALGVRRYGFHGLSYEYLMEELARVAGPAAAAGRIILAHLGNGASMVAVREGGDVAAAEAVALFCQQAKKWIGAYAAVLGGLDTLVFAGGIGENAAPVRARICEGLGFLGLEVDAPRNGMHAPVVSTPASRVSVRVMHTNEERMIASSVCRLLGWTGENKG